MNFKSFFARKSTKERFISVQLVSKSKKARTHYVSEEALVLCAIIKGKVLQFIVATMKRKCLILLVVVTVSKTEITFI